MFLFGCGTSFYSSVRSEGVCNRPCSFSRSDSLLYISPSPHCPSILFCLLYRPTLVCLTFCHPTAVSTRSSTVLTHPPAILCLLTLSIKDLYLHNVR